MKEILRTFITLISTLILVSCAQSVRQNSSVVENRLSHDSLLYSTLVAEMAGHKGNFKESVSHYRRVVKETRQLPVVSRAVRIMMYAREFDAANETIQKWLDLAPEDLEAHQLAATIALQQGNIRLASDRTEWLLAHSGNKQGYKMLAALLERLDKPDVALKVMESLLINHREDIAAQVLYARIALNANKYRKARSAANHAVSLDPDNVEAQIILARSRIELGEIEQSLSELKAAVEKSSKNRELRLSYARLLVSSNRFESAIRQFEMLIQLTPKNADLMYSTALVMLQIKRYSEAEQYFRKLSGLGSHRQQALYYLGRLEEDRKQFEAALGWYRQVGDGVFYIEARMSAARVQGKTGEIAQARERFALLRESNQKSVARIWLSESDMFRELNQDQAAYEVLEEAVKQIPESVDLLYSKALAAERIGRIDILEQDLKVVLKRQPDHAHALNALGYTLADRTQRYTEAFKYIQQALKLEPSDPAIIDSMGWIQYRLGNLEQALEYLRRASIKLLDGEVAAHLGEVLWVSGEREAATQVWDKALLKYPDSEVLIKAIRRFNP